MRSCERFSVGPYICSVCCGFICVCKKRRFQFPLTIVWILVLLARPKLAHWGLDKHCRSWLIAFYATIYYGSISVFRRYLNEVCQLLLLIGKLVLGNRFSSKGPPNISQAMMTSITCELLRNKQTLWYVVSIIYNPWIASIYPLGCEIPFSWKKMVDLACLYHSYEMAWLLASFFIEKNI